MKNFVVLPAVVLGACALVSAQGQPAGAARPAAPAVSGSAAGPSKVAILYLQNAMLSTGEGKKAATELQGKFTPRRSTLEKRQADIQAMQDQLKKGGATMSDDAKNKMARQIEVDAKALQRDADELNADADQEQGRVFQDLSQKLYAVVSQYATQNGYAVVLDVSNNQQSPILWAAASTDITNDIVKLYDQAHPAAAAAAPAAPAAARPAPPAAPPARKKQ
jgi:outer membrane protein